MYSPLGWMGVWVRVKDKIKWYIVLHFIFFIYSVCTMLGKMAGKYEILSANFMLLYGLSITCMVIYALVWQQVIKRLPLITAYASKAVTVLWGMVFGAAIFEENIKLKQVFAAGFIFAGIILFVISDQKQEKND